MIRVSKCAWILCSASILAGCFAGQVTVAPALRGRVVDSGSNSPIAGATVFRPCKNPEEKKVTDGDGRFSFIRSTGGSVFIVGNIRPDEGKSSIGFSADGFASCCLPLVVDRGSSAEKDLGDILLESGNGDSIDSNKTCLIRRTTG